jgi:hypothetical protein
MFEILVSTQDFFLPFVDLGLGGVVFLIDPFHDGRDHQANNCKYHQNSRPWRIFQKNPDKGSP